MMRAEIEDGHPGLQKPLNKCNLWGLKGPCPQRLPHIVASSDPPRAKSKAHRNRNA